MTQSYQIQQESLQPSQGIFKFFPILSELKAPCFGLWTYLRGLDRKGSGWLVVDVAIACIHLECAESTFRSWLTSGLGTWFSGYERLEKNQIRIHYRSLEKICKEFALADLGPIGYVSYKALTRSARKIVAAEFEIALAQHQAWYATRKKLEGADRDRIQNPADIVFSRRSALLRQSGVSRSRQFLVIRSDANQIPHTTIEKLSNRLGKSWSTAQRRLSNLNRIEKGFEPLDRCQILRRFSSEESNAYDRFRAFHNSKQLGENSRTGTQQRVIRYGGDYCWAGGNIYNPQVELKMFKAQRSRIKKAVEAVNALL